MSVAAVAQERRNREPGEGYRFNFSIFLKIVLHQHYRYWFFGQTSRNGFFFHALFCNCQRVFVWGGGGEMVSLTKRLEGLAVYTCVIHRAPRVVMVSSSSRVGWVVFVFRCWTTVIKKTGPVDAMMR